MPRRAPTASMIRWFAWCGMNQSTSSGVSEAWSRISRQTSSMHGPDGYLTVDPEVIAANQERLHNKLIRAVDTFTFYDLQEEPDARILLITYGITARSVLAAAKSLSRSGTPVSVLTLKTLWPLPVDLIKKTAASYQQMVVVEMNLGQYVHDIRGIITDRPVKFLGQMDGSLITPAQIEEFVANV